MSTNFTKQSPIAIIGMGCIFAKSPDLKAYLRLVMGGIDGISDPPDSHIHLRQFYDADPKRADHIYCNRGGFLPYSDFDPTEFGMPPNVLEATDTSQLLGLLTAKKALEDAGYGANGKPFDRQRTSVILGVTGTQELVIPLGARLGHPLWRRALAKAGVAADTAEEVVRHIGDSYVQWQENSFPGLLGNVVAGRIANRLDLGGTNCVVDAACASSLAALNLSLLDLQAGRSDLIISGGVDTINDAFMYMCFAKTHILSASGDVRPFSQEADGTLLGEGIGLIVLKRLEDAERDNDRIYAVIRGIGAGSDGKSQSIYSPRLAGQAQALNRAYANAGLDPTQVGLIEAHGTGTRVGDEVEFQALRQIFASDALQTNQCALGSVKSNIGHTKAAAGTAGLMKATLALYHKILPPTLKAESIDPKLDIVNSPFYINQAMRPWLPSKQAKRFAGVSAFGFGGSNFHVVLEEYESAKSRISWDGCVEIVAFGAESRIAIVEQLNQWRQSTENGHSDSFGAIATASRQKFQSTAAARLIMVLPAPGDHDLIRQYHAAAHAMLTHSTAPAPAFADRIFVGEGTPSGGLAFLFPGQGSQYVGMGRHIVCHFPDSLDAMAEAGAFMDIDPGLDEYLYPRFPENKIAHETRLRRTDIAQPAIGVISTAMLAALRYFNVNPDATCGHSYGELVALHAAGWLSRTDLWRLSVARGKLMAAACQDGEDCGCMLAVLAPIAELKDIVRLPSGDLVIANFNAPEQTVLSGTTPAIENAEQVCRQRGWRSIRLPVTGAFHSSFMAPARSAFQQILDRTDFQPGKTPVMSNALADAYPLDPVQIRHSLGQQLDQPVHFHSNIEKLYQGGIRTYIEVGPKSVLTGLVGSILRGRAYTAIALDRSNGRQHGIMDLAAGLSHLAAIGYPVDLTCWEEPMAMADSLPRMRIPINGTNFRSSKSTTAAGDTAALSSPVSSGIQPVAVSAVSRPSITGSTAGPPADTSVLNETASAFPAACCGPKSLPGRLPVTCDGESFNVPTSEPTAGRVSPPSNSKNIMAHQSNDERIRQVLATVQQGLASMQALQAQTTQAHQKFLEVQAEANRTLAAMIQSTRYLSEQSNEPASFISRESSDTDPVRSAGPAAVTSPTSDAKVQPAALGPIGQKTAPVFARAAKRTPPSSSKPTAAPPAIAQAVLAIVAELTGYPEKMLGMDMDIESDLGIDSIKRVEILSAVEEKMPQLPKVTPDMLGDLKTLGHICGFLCSGNRTPEAHHPNGDAAQNHADRSHWIAEAADPVLLKKDSRQEIQAAVLAIVSELTGYPEKMLGMDMDIESDLGIDSIKRVEILSAVEEKMPQLPKVTPDMLGDLKTLGHICGFLADGADHATAATHTGDENPGPEQSPGEQVQPPARFIVVPKSLQFPHLDQAVAARIAENLPILIVSEPCELADILAHYFQSLGFAAKVISAKNNPQPEDQAAGLVLIAPIAPKHAFAWAQTCGPLLQQASERGHSFFCSISFLDGAFGFAGGQWDDLSQGALAGLVKTAALEWPDVHCRALDIDPHWQHSVHMAEAIAAEILQKDPAAPVEIGLSAEKRYGLELVPCGVAKSQVLNLGKDDVVVVTGGARGITALAAKALSLHTRCRLALLGRSAEPRPEPEWLSGWTSPTEVKKAILARGLQNQDTTPMELEKAFRLWMANREILQTMADLNAAGIMVRYFSVDVRRSTAMTRILDLIRNEMGPIRALIHGAGVLEDRLIVDKTVTQFEHVYNTKVQGFSALIQAAAADELRYITIFSSVSGRLGNIGQSDYAMANETLNKMAQRQARQRPGCKVVSINWGPWDGGMVGNGLKRHFADRGISLIAPEQGAKAMITEMAASRTEPIEVVIGGLFTERLPSLADPSPERLQPWADDTGEVLNLAAKRQIDLKQYPVLQSHYLDGRPVVPLALIAEWLAQGALHANPGLMLYGIDHLRLFKGITLDTPSKNISLMTGNPRRNGALFEVNVEIHDADGRFKNSVHSCATAVLTDRLPAAPKFEENGHFKASPALRSPEDYYRNVLFHGEALKGLKKIIRISDQGMTAAIESAPAPKKWINHPWRNSWVLDPLVLDCAFQMAIIWCHEQIGQVSLPNYVNAYRQYCDRFPDRGVIAILEVEKTTAHKMIGRFTFLDESKRIVAKLEGFEAIMDHNLVKAFGVKAA